MQSVHPTPNGFGGLALRLTARTSSGLPAEARRYAGLPFEAAHPTLKLRRAFYLQPFKNLLRRIFIISQGCTPTLKATAH